MVWKVDSSIHTHNPHRQTRGHVPVDGSTSQKPLQIEDHSCKKRESNPDWPLPQSSFLAHNFGGQWSNQKNPLPSNLCTWNFIRLISQVGLHGTIKNQFQRKSHWFSDPFFPDLNEGVEIKIYISETKMVRIKKIYL